MTRLLLLAPLLAILLLAWPARSEAQTCSATITDIDFGAAGLLSSSPTDAMATVSVTCTRIPLLGVVKVCPNIGDGSVGDNGSARLMSSAGGGLLTYQLYQDSGRTQGWGASDETQLGTVPPMLLSGGLSGAATSTLTLYARLFGGQTGAAPGDYVSVYSGAETAFTYSTYLLGASSSCTGFSGTATVRPTFTVRASPPATCTLSAADLDFGTVGVLTSAVRAQSSLRLACTINTAYAVTLDGGLAAAAPASRRMTSSAGDIVTYGLYRDSARSQPWGSDTATRLSGTGTGAELALPIYGLVPAQATPRPGAYSDRVVATVTY